jgi:hypothetical protein
MNLVKDSTALASQCDVTGLVGIMGRLQVLAIAGRLIRAFASPLDSAIGGPRWASARAGLPDMEMPRQYHDSIIVVRDDLIYRVTRAVKDLVRERDVQNVVFMSSNHGNKDGLADRKRDSTLRYSRRLSMPLTGCASVSCLC